jgi:plastocyanin
MGFLFRSVVLALVVYGGWQFWQNYDLEGWYQNCKNATVRTRVCLRFPNERGSQTGESNVFKIKEACVFEPEKLEVVVGDRVYWRNETDAPWQVISVNFESNVILPGKEFSKKFTEPGKFYFTCEDGSGGGEVIIN